MFQPLSICDAASQIRRGRLTPLRLVERCLDQIRKYEHQVHAWVVVDEEGARRSAEQLQREGWRGPLHGIPLGIKDIIDVEGFPTRAGSPLREEHVAGGDAPLVAALRRAGAIILGKTVTVEFACFDPSPTLNPWDPALKHTPGGSSSGSAVAVALGMCPGAIGTQTGGSLVRPSAYCGVATCKPTFGRIDTRGIVPVSYHFDHPGPMARSVADLEVILSCMLGAERFRPPAAGNTVPPAARDAVPPAAGDAVPRLGLMEEFFIERAAGPVRQVMQSVLETLRRGGASVEPISSRLDFTQIQPLHRLIMAVEAAEYHRRQFAAHRQSYGPMISALLDEGLGVSAVDYAQALAHQRGFRRRVDELLERCHQVDALVMPSTDTTAPATLRTTGTPKFQAPWSYAGVPAVSIPCGLADDGMPVGLQLVGRRHGEATLLAVARWCERELAFTDLPPLLSADS